MKLGAIEAGGTKFVVCIGNEKGEVLERESFPTEAPEKTMENVFKFFDGKGYKLSDSLEDQIQAVIESGFEGVPSPVGGDVGRSYTEETALREYIDYSLSTIKTDLKGLRVALDCAYGAD